MYHGSKTMALIGLHVLGKNKLYICNAKIIHVDLCSSTDFSYSRLTTTTLFRTLYIYYGLYLHFFKRILFFIYFEGY